jgi:hypothetical protein
MDPQYDDAGVGVEASGISIYDPPDPQSPRTGAALGATIGSGPDPMDDTRRYEPVGLDPVATAVLRREEAEKEAADATAAFEQARKARDEVMEAARKEAAVVEAARWALIGTEVGADKAVNVLTKTAVRVVDAIHTPGVKTSLGELKTVLEHVTEALKQITHNDLKVVGVRCEAANTDSVRYDVGIYTCGSESALVQALCHCSCPWGTGWPITIGPAAGHQVAININDGEELESLFHRMLRNPRSDLMRHALLFSAPKELP